LNKNQFGFAGVASHVLDDIFGKLLIADMKDFEDQDLFGNGKKAKPEKKHKEAEPQLGFDFSFAASAEKPPVPASPDTVQPAPMQEPEKADQTPPEKASPPDEAEKEDSVAKDPSPSVSEQQPAPQSPASAPEKMETKPAKTLHELKEIAKNVGKQEEGRQEKPQEKQSPKSAPAPVKLMPVAKQDKAPQQPKEKPQTHGQQHAVPQKQPAAPEGRQKMDSPIRKPAQQQQTLQPKPHPKHIVISDGASIGHILQEARSKNGLSVDQVAIETRIKKSYIEALERDDYEQLPSSVYAKAYVRRLCQQYGLDESISAKAIKGLKGKASESAVPDDVLAELEKGKQVNVEKQGRLKTFNIAVTACIVAVVAVACIVAFITMRKGKVEGAKPAISSDGEGLMATEEMDRRLKEILVSYPAGNMSELKAPER
jgi:transcriptional regulator with XRE-family HTH domain